MRGTESVRATAGGLLREARQAFRERLLPTADLDARLLVGGILGMDATALLTEEKRVVDAEEEARVRIAIAARLSGRPVHRILGRREFYGHMLRLSPQTLEPRPDTEILVDAALVHLQTIVAAKGSCRIVDLGAGTGAVGLALLAESEAASCLGVDCAPGAVATALANAADLGLSSRYDAIAGNWLEGIRENFDLVVSNPPYIPSADIGCLDVEVRLNDPIAALDGGADGLDAYRSIAAQARTHLNAGGIIAVEIGEGQRADVKAIFSAEGFGFIECRPDLAGIDRVLVFGFE